MTEPRYPNTNPSSGDELYDFMGKLCQMANTGMAAVLRAGSAIIGAVFDAGPSWVTSRGIAGARFSSFDQSGDVASITDAPPSGQKLEVTDILISSDTALRLDFSVESDATVIESIFVGANSSVQFTPRGKWKLPTMEKKLQVRASAAGNISLTPFYFFEA